VDALRFGLAAALVLLVPGAVLAVAAGGARRLSRAEALAWCLGASPALWSLAFLWTRVAGLDWGRAACLAALGSGCLYLCWRGFRRRSGRRRALVTRRNLATAAALTIVLAALVLRLRDARGLAAAPWVDGYHHTVITQLFLEQGGLPRDYRPYVAADRFDYHFGFHALCASICWTSGLEPRRVVLWTGQLLAALAPLTVLLLARLLGLGSGAALCAAALPAAWLWFPAYYLSWGRYTQLTGLLLLPAALWSLRQALHAADSRAGIGWRRVLAPGATAALLAAGLLLTHYRVTLLFLVAAPFAAWTGSWRGTGKRLASASVLGVLAIAAMAPWLRMGLGVALTAFVHPAAGPASAASGEVAQAAPGWILTQHGGGFWLRLALLGLAWASFARRRGAWALVAWTVLALLLTRPAAWGQSRAWAMPPFALAISLWLAVAIGCGWLAEGMAGLDWHAPRVRRWAVLLLAAFVGVAWLGRGADLADAPESLAAVVAAALGLGLLAGQPGRRRPGTSATQGPLIAAALALTLVGAWTMPEVLNEGTVILRPQELPAAAWIRDHCPGDARFFINQAAWNQGAYRGVDGGYWLPLTAGRAVSLPAAVYALHDLAMVHAVQARAERLAAADRLTDAELQDLLDEAKAGWIYLGPGSKAPARGMLTAERLDRVAGLSLRYDRDGVRIYERLGRTRVTAAGHVIYSR